MRRILAWGLTGGLLILIVMGLFNFGMVGDFCPLGTLAGESCGSVLAMEAMDHIAMWQNLTGMLSGLILVLGFLGLVGVKREELSGETSVKILPARILRDDHKERWRRWLMKKNNLNPPGI